MPIKSLLANIIVNGASTASKIVSSNSTKDNADLTAGHMNWDRCTITTAGSLLVNWDMEETGSILCDERCANSIVSPRS